MFYRVGTTGGKLVPAQSLVHVVPIASAVIREGDLVLLERESQKVCHRVLQIRYRTGLAVEILSKGDGCERSDGWIPSSQCIGKVMEVNSVPVMARHFRLVSRLYYWHSKLGWFLLEYSLTTSLGAKIGRFKHSLWKGSLTHLWLRLLQNE